MTKNNNFLELLKIIQLILDQNSFIFELYKTYLVINNAQFVTGRFIQSFSS